ncbi:MAG: response regulator [Candidatus Zixiibacteriota bacterium]|nr:MAG: response regulator [candidate division Zixibacteria bacterium]
MKNILIVDDEEDIRNLYESEFEIEGYNTHSVSSGSEALEFIKKNSNLDLVILDIKMDDLDGLEVLENIRTETNKVPVILNSAYSTYKNNFTSWLADAYLVKSSNLSELKDKVQELLSV